MANTLETSLLQFGLSKNASKVAIALFSLHHGNAKQISELANIPRTTVYRSLSELIKRNLVKEKMINKKQVWEIVSPAELDKQMQELRHGYHAHLPSLLKSYKEARNTKEDTLPYITIRKGKEVFNAYSPLLQLKKGERIYGIEGARSIEEKIFNYREKEIIQWQEEVKSRGIIIESIANEAAIKNFLKSKRSVLLAHHGRPVILYLLPGHFLNMGVDIIVYRDNVLQIDHLKNIAITIHSKELAQTYKELFEIAKKSGIKVNLNELIKEKLGA